MGFRLPSTTYRIQIDEGAYKGAEALVEGMDTGQTIELTRLSEEVSTNGAPGAVEGMIVMFAAALREWNIETEDGNPIPSTFDGVKSVPFPLVIEFTRLWLNAGGGVDAPLDATLNGGAPPAAAPIPMAPL